MSAWDYVSLGAHCDKIGSGATPRGGESVYVETGVALIRSQNVYNGEFSESGLARITEKHADQLAGVSVEESDILLNITGDSVARSCQVPKTALPARVNQHVAIIRPKKSSFDPRFLSYYLTSPYMQRLMLSLAGAGGTRKALTKEMIERFSVPRPPQTVQSRVVSLLSAYDDLIENNRKRIALLEETARLLYREWFVHLRFPGHEHVAVVDGVPEGWARRSLGEVADCRLGKMLDQNKNRGEFMPYLANVNVRWGAIDLDNLREMRFEDDELDAVGLRYGDIVMCEGGEPGRCALWKEQVPKMVIQKAIHRIRAHEEMSYLFLYRCLRYQGESGQLTPLFTGATIKHLPREKLVTAPVVAPPAPLMAVFAEQVKPIEKQIAVLEAASRRAANARDLLLPRLMNGEIAV